MRVKEAGSEESLGGAWVLAKGVPEVLREHEGQRARQKESAEIQISGKRIQLEDGELGVGVGGWGREGRVNYAVRFHLVLVPNPISQLLRRKIHCAPLPDGGAREPRTGRGPPVQV